MSWLLLVGKNDSLFERFGWQFRTIFQVYLLELLVKFEKFEPCHTQGEPQIERDTAARTLSDVN